MGLTGVYRSIGKKENYKLEWLKKTVINHIFKNLIISLKKYLIWFQ